MSSGNVDLASLAIKIDVTDVKSAINELDNLTKKSEQVQKSVEDLKGYFASLGSSVRQSLDNIDSSVGNHVKMATDYEKKYTSNYDAELKARELKSLQSSDRRLSQILELQVKIAAKERQLQEQSLAQEKIVNDKKLILTAKTLNEIEALKAANASKQSTQADTKLINLNAYKAETAGLLFEFERRVQLEQSTILKGENTKATIRLKYAQQEELVRARLANSLTQVQFSLEQGFINSVQAAAARASIMERAEEELIATNNQLSSSLKAASDANDIFHRAMSKSLDMLIRMAAYRAITILAGLPSELFEVNKNFQLLRINLEGVIKSSEGARLEMMRLKALDLKTPFDLQELAKADLMMRNFGLAMTDNQFKAITDQVAQLGGNSETLTGILRQLGQAWGKNKLQLVDLRPMIEQGLPAITLLANAYGKNTIEILEMVHAGELGQEAIVKLFDAMEKNAPDAAAKNMATLSGASSNLKSTWEQLLDAMMGPRLESIISTVIEGMTSILALFRDMFDMNGFLIVADGLDFIGKNLKVISQMFENMGSFRIADKLASIFSSSADYYRELNDKNNKSDKDALAKADKERVAAQAKEIEEYEKFLETHNTMTGKGAKETNAIEKSANALKKELYDKEVDYIKQVESAKLEAIEADKASMMWLLENNKVSIQEYYEKQLELIEQVKQAKIEAASVQIAKEQELFVATQATGKITKEIADAIDANTKRFNLPSGLIESVINTESRFNPNAVSQVGAQGLMQLMPDTGKEMGLKDPFNIQQNIEAGSKYLAKMLEKYHGELQFAIAAYNSGPGNVSGGYTTKAGKHIAQHEPRIPNITETQNYVKSVLGYYTALEKSNEKINELSAVQEKAQQSALNQTNKLSSDVLVKQEKQAQAIAAQDLKVKQLITSENDLANIRKNAQLAEEQSLEKNNAYQQAKVSGDKAGQAAFEAEARIKVEKTVADAEIKLINDVRDTKVKSFENAQRALDFSLAQNQISNEEYSAGAIDLIHKELAVKLNALDEANEKYKRAGLELPEYDNSKLKIIEDAKSKELEVSRASITMSKQYQDELAREELALFALSNAIEEVVKKERELFLKTNKNYLAAKAKDNSTGSNDAQTFLNRQDVIGDAKIKKAELDHLQRLVDINRSYKEVGINASQAFDIIGQGTGAIVTAFDGFIAALDNISAKFQQNSKDFKQLEEDKKTLGDARYLEQYNALIEKQKALETQKTQATLQGFAQITGGAKNMFKENSAGYKAMETAEKVFRAFEIANAVKTFLVKQGFLTAFLGLDTVSKATQIASDAVWTTTFVASSAVRATAAGTEAAAKSLTAGPPPFSFAALAATLAVLAGLGVLISGGGGSAPNISEDRQKAQGAGTVLGDVEAKSESITNSLEAIKDVDLTMLPLTGQMAKSLLNIENDIAGLGALLSRSIYNDGKGPDTSKMKLGKVSNFKDPFDFLGNMFGLGDMLFGSTKRTLEDYGLFLRDQTINQIKNAGVAVQQYTTIKEKSSALFGLFSSTSVKNQFSSVDKETQDQFTKVILGVVNSVGSATKLLGVSSSQFEERLSKFVLKIGYVSLKDLKGQELQDALESVFGKASDQIAKAAFNGLQEFQRVGEGYFETVVRVATGVEQASASLASLNIKAVAYTSIIDKQGDVFAEIVKQSIVNIEQERGIVNNVGKIISTLQGSGTDLISTYKELIDVRNLLVATKLDKNALSTSLFQGAGSLSDLRDSLRVFNEEYFTKAEQVAAKSKELTIEFAKLGFVMPVTKDGFRKLVDGINTSTDAGKQLLGQVLRLAGSFNDLSTSAQDYRKSLEDQVMAAFDTAENLLQKQIDQYSSFIKAMKNLSNSLLTGNNTILSNPEQYQRARGQVAKYQDLLMTGTDEEKKEAREKLPGLIQQFLDMSKKYNASGLGYVKDFTNMQALIAKNIDDAEEQKTIYEQQLEQLIAQLTALGLLKTSVDNVELAVKAVNDAINNLTKFQVAQAAGNKELTNQSAFATVEQQRLSSYNSGIETEAGKRAATGNAIEGMVGWSAGTSRLPFSASGKFDAESGKAFDITSQASGSNADSIMSNLKEKTFPRLANSLSLVGKQIQHIIGGVLPQVAFSFGDDKEYGTGFAEYSFGGKRNRVSTDSLQVLERVFAKDMTTYLLKQMDNKDWSSKLSQVQFSTLGNGLSQLYTMFAKLKNPFKEGVYDPKVDYTKKVDGSHRMGIDKVPFDGYIAELHENEKVLTSGEARQYDQVMSAKPTASKSNELDELKQEIIKLRMQNEKQLALLKASNDIDRKGYNEVIANLKDQVSQMQVANRNNARVVRER